MVVAYVERLASFYGPAHGSARILAGQKAELESLMNTGGASYSELQEASLRYQSLSAEQDSAELRWLELSEIGE